MHNNKKATRANPSIRIAIALATSLTALWLLPDPAGQESSTLAKPNDTLPSLEKELNVYAQPNPQAVKPIRHTSL